MRTPRFQKSGVNPVPLLIMLALALAAGAARAQTGWTNLCGIGGLQTEAYGIAVDAATNVLVTGQAQDGGDNYYFGTVKYSAAGLPLWTNLYHIADLAAGNAVAVDTNGNVFVTGTADNPGSIPSTYVPNNATIKYSSAGVPLWTNLFTLENGATGVAIKVDTNGNVFVAGTVLFTPYAGYPAAIKYSNGGVPLWTNLFTSTTNDLAVALALDGGGNVFVADQSYFTNIQGACATIKYSNSGVPLWTNLFTESDGALPTALAVDGNGDALVTARAVTNGISFCATIKYSGAGVPLWTNLYSAPDSATPVAVAVDQGGDVYITGQARITSTIYFCPTIKYSSAGIPLWTNSYSISNDVDVGAIAVDDNGDAFVTSRATDHSGTNYCATLEYSSAGVPLWTNLFTMTYGAFGSAVALDGNGDAFVAGTGIAANVIAYYVTIEYPNVSSTAPAPAALGVSRSGDQLVLSWATAGFTLQSTAQLGVAAAWNTVSPPPVIVNGLYTVTNSISGAQQFYRLSQ